MLKSECCVCGARRKFKSLVYDQSMNAYCFSANICTKGHPNSTSNKQQRGAYIDMMSHEDAMQIQKQRTEYTYEETANTFGKRVRNVNMHKLVTGSISFRVQTETQADYISYTLAKIGSNKISEALHYILNVMIERDSTFLSQHGASRATYAATPLPEQDQEQEQPREREQKIPSYKPQADEGVFTL